MNDSVGFSSSLMCDSLKSIVKNMSKICDFVNKEVSEASSELDSSDATWILTSSFIIFTMQSGFGLLEAGRM